YNLAPATPHRAIVAPSSCEPRHADRHLGGPPSTGPAQSTNLPSWPRSKRDATLPLQPVTPESRQICGKIKTEKMRREQGKKCPLGAAEDIPRFAVAAAPMVRHLRKLHLLRGR